MVEEARTRLAQRPKAAVEPSNAAAARSAISVAVAVSAGDISSSSVFASAGAIHGDMYAHNVLFRSSKRGVPAAKLGDFGAAFFYPPGSEIGREFERTEARAWGIAATEALKLWDGTGDRAPLDALKRLALECVGERGKRPSFAEIVARVGEPEGV